MVVGRRSLACFVMAAVCAKAAPTAAAESPPPPNGAARPAAGAEIQLPVAVTTTVEYPAGETRTATVVLELEVDARGVVTQARAVTGEPPFSDVAVEAARRFTFIPAKRGAEPVRSRFRFTIQFEPPPPETPVAVPPPSATAAPHPPGPPPILEVVVQGERPPKPPPGTVTITRADAEALPGTFGDPLRAIEAEPGVVPIVSGLPSFFVRGAPPANVGFFIDGVDVPLLYHAFFGPSVLHPGLIQDVHLYKSTGPVDFGRFAGPVVSATLTPMQHRFNGEANVRLIDAGALVEAPIGPCPDQGKPDCSVGSVRVGGRYAYTGLILSQLSDAKLNYWDYQAQGTVAVGRHDELGVLAFGAYDYFNAGASSDQGGGKVRFHRVDLRWDHHVGHTHLRVALTGGYDSTGGVEATTSVVRDRSLRARSELVSELSEAVTLHAGLDGRVDDFALDTNPLLLNFADYSILFVARTTETVGGYLSAELRPTRRITVVPGIRSDLYWDSGHQAVGVDPRVSAAFAVTDQVTIETSIGMSHQLPNFVPNVPAAQIADLQGGLQEAIIFDSGVKWRLPSDITAKATVYRAGYFNALDPLGGKRDFSIDRESLNQRSTIASGGLELSLARPLTRKLGGFLAYTLSRTTESFGTQSQVSGFDRPHVFQAALGYDFGRGWSAGARAIFYSGVPELSLQGSPHFSTDRRGRPYFRVDLRAEKRWHLGARAWWGIVFEMLNATGTSEVVRLDCGERCAERTAGPVVLPSLGIQAAF